MILNLQEKLEAQLCFFFSPLQLLAIIDRSGSLPLGSLCIALIMRVAVLNIIGQRVGKVGIYSVDNIPLFVRWT